MKGKRGEFMKIQVFEPPMCCSTGLCGPSVDPVLVAFSADLDWLKRNGIEIERYNLSQQTAAFISNEPVCELLRKQGNGCLPIVIVDGAVVSSGVYPDREALAKLAGLPVEVKAASLKFTVQTTEATSSGCCSTGTSESDESCCDQEAGESKSDGQSCCS